MTTSELRQFIVQLPKAELHLHIEGTLEAQMIFDLAQRNNISLPYADLPSLQAAYEFHNLQSFLDLYYAGANVLITEQDFFDMTWAYLERAHADGIVHCELMVDPQTHTSRGIAVQTVLDGIVRAMRQAKERWQIRGCIILSFLRHLSEDEASAVFEDALALRERYPEWLAVGLDSSEKGNPPEKFKNIYARCKEAGFKLTAHAGEEGPPSYVWGSLNDLMVERIDHGVRSEEDPKLIAYLREHKIPLTVCPLSNLKLCVVKDLKEHNLKRLLEEGLCVTINSDDPAYFGGYLVDNYVAIAQALDLSKDQLEQLARNSLVASFQLQ